MQCLLQNRLYVKAEKCEFHSSSVTFLGSITAEGEIHMDSEKVQAICDWPKPDSRKQLQRFLGFPNFYRRFIKNFSSVAPPLHALTSACSHFIWNKGAESAFNILKDRFTSPPVLTLPDPKLQFVVEVDASDVGVGAILSQRTPHDGRLCHCTFLSKKNSALLKKLRHR